MNSVYVRRADSMESFPISSGHAPKPRKMVLLSGDASTGEDGELSLNFAEIPFAYANAWSAQLVQQSGYFHLPSAPSIAVDWGPFFWLAFSHDPQVLVSPYRPVDEASPLLPAEPVCVTCRAEKVKIDTLELRYLDPDQRVVSWDLDGSDARCDHAVWPNFYALRLIVRSWRVDGQPAPGVGVTWQLLGEMRFITKALESEINFPEPCAP